MGAATGGEPDSIEQGLPFILAFPLAGIITDGDLRRHMDGLLDKTAAEVMTASPATIAPGAMAEEAVAVMNQRKITCLFVVDPDNGSKAEGLLHIHDCLRAGLG